MSSIFKFSTPRVAELDGLRGFALLLIIVFHYGNNQIILTENPSSFVVQFSKLSSFTGTSLDLFFVLSGYLIGNILLKNKKSKNYFRTFYIRRFLRIIPPVFLLLLTYELIKKLEIDDPEGFLFANEIPLWTYFAFVQNYAMALSDSYGARILTPTWSLGVEEQFYAILPAIVFFIRKRSLPYIFIMLIVLAPVFRFFTSSMYMEYLPFQMRMDSLFLGVLVAYLLKEKKLKEKIKNNAILLYFCLFACLCLVIVLSYTNKVGVLYHTLFNFVYALLLLSSLTYQTGVLGKVLRSKLLRFFGLVSYGVYLFHQLISGVLHSLILDSQPRLATISELWVTVLSFGTTVVFSYFLHLFIERPFIRWGHQFKYN